MRPVNLIPAEERRGSARSSRTGPAAYLLIGALVAILAAVTALVMANNKISEHQADIDRLEQQEQAAVARAESLRAFADFAASEGLRTATVTTLAQSRFDWERVLRELAVVIPAGVTLETLTGSVNPSVSVGSGADVSLRGEIEGPALSLIGCAQGHEGVAALVAALEDIDGVTRVGLADSLSEGEDGGGSTAASCVGGTSFGVVVAFDEVAVPGATATPPPPTTDDAGVAAAAQQQADAAGAVQDSAARAESAVNSTAGQ